MDTPATAPVVDTASLISAAIGGGDVVITSLEPASTDGAPPNGDTPAAPVLPVTPATPAVPDTPATPAQEEPEVPKELDATDRYLQGLAEETTPAVLDDTAKALFKTHLGIEDVEAFKTERNTDKQLITEFKGKADAHDAMLDRISKMPFELSRAIEAHAKGEDFRPYLEPLSQGITLSKEAKNIDRYALTKREFPDQFTAEELQSIQDGTADDHLEAAFAKFHQLASRNHDGKRTEEVQRIKDGAAQEAAWKEQNDKATAAAIALVSNSKSLSVLATPDLTERFRNGSLEREVLYNADGTRKPEGFALLLKGLHHDTVVDRARKGAQAKGEVDGELEARRRLPTQPAQGPGGRVTTQPKKDQQQEQALKLVNDALVDALA